MKFPSFERFRRNQAATAGGEGERLTFNTQSKKSYTFQQPRNTPLAGPSEFERALGGILAEVARHIADIVIGNFPLSLQGKKEQEVNLSILWDKIDEYVVKLQDLEPLDKLAKTAHLQQQAIDFIRANLGGINHHSYPIYLERNVVFPIRKESLRHPLSNAMIRVLANEKDSDQNLEAILASLKNELLVEESPLLSVLKQYPDSKKEILTFYSSISRIAMQNFCISNEKENYHSWKTQDNKTIDKNTTDFVNALLEKYPEDKHPGVARQIFKDVCEQMKWDVQHIWYYSDNEKRSFYSEYLKPIATQGEQAFQTKPGKSLTAS